MIYHSVGHGVHNFALAAALVAALAKLDRQQIRRRAFTSDCKQSSRKRERTRETESSFEEDIASEFLARRAELDALVLHHFREDDALQVVMHHIGQRAHTLYNAEHENQ